MKNSERAVKEHASGVNCFFVVRHGETQANVLGINAGPLRYSLTKKGKMEIEYLAKMLSKTKISAIYSSPIFVQSKLQGYWLVPTS